MVPAKLLFLSFSEALKIQRKRNGPNEIAIFEAVKACFGTKLRITEVAQKENQKFPKGNKLF